MPNKIESQEDLFKAIIWDSLVEAALRKLFAALPGLAWGPMGLFTTWIVGKYADALYEHAKVFIKMEVVAIKNEQFERAFETEQVKLKLVARDKGIDSPEYRSQREKAKAQLSLFLRYDAAR